MIREENGKIIVDNLRPMSEKPAIPLGELVAYGLVYFKHSRIGEFVVFTPNNGWNISLSGALGWIPMPTYQPKEK